MNTQVQLQAYTDQRLPMRMAVKVAGRAGHICGRSFAIERYDVVFQDRSVMPGLPREIIEPDWSALRA